MHLFVNRTGLLFLPIAIIVSVFSCNTAKNGEQKQGHGTEIVKAISEFNASCMSDSLWTGAVVLAGTPDKTVFHQAWGYTSAENTLVLPENAIFDLASVTKAVATATAIAICMDRGWIDLNTPFSRYLPKYRGELKEYVTVIDLARHISGFDNNKPFLEKKGEAMIDDLLGNSPLRLPGQYEYACVNYILLGLIVEKVSGEALDLFCEKNIFAPLSMVDTHFSPVKKTKRVVKSPFTPEQGVASDNPARAAGRPVGNAGLFSTADDLAKYCRMILANGTCGDKRILSGKAIMAMKTKTDACSPLAFGWFVDEKRNPPLLSSSTLNHNGWAGNSIWIDLSQQCFVIVLTNRSGDHGKAAEARLELAGLVVKKMCDELVSAD